MKKFCRKKDLKVNTCKQKRKTLYCRYKKKSLLVRATSLKHLISFYKKVQVHFGQNKKQSFGGFMTKRTELGGVHKYSIFRILIAFFMAFLAFFASSCSESSDDDDEPVLSSISITAPAKKTYFIGESLDTAGMKVTAKYSDDSAKDVTASENIRITGFDSSKAAESQTITVTYQEKTATFTVKIIAAEVTKIEITKEPTKTEYFVGAVQLNLTGLKVTATYKDGSTADVTTDVTTSGFDSSAAVESQTITVTYGGKKATFDVKIVKANVKSITIKTKPNKLEYFTGGEIDLTGLEVTATYEDTTSSPVKNDDLEITGFDSSNATDKQTITVTYGGKTATFDVKIVKANVTSITIKTQPNKLEYFTGGEIDLTGLEVTATYEDTTSSPVKNDDLEITGFDSSKEADSQTVTVTYGEKTATFTVKIKQGYTFHNTVTTLASGTGSYGTDEATYVEFGDWPQDVVPTEDVATLGLETSKDKVTRGYMEFVQGTDGNYYVKCTENAYESGYKYQDNTNVRKGGTNSRWFKVMPIKWRVADTAYDVDGIPGSSTGKLLVAENILTGNVPYYEDIQNYREIEGKTVYPNNYMHSQIRAYLNGNTYTGYDTTTSSNIEKSQWNNKGFLQTAFTSEAADKIITTKVDNSKEQMSYDRSNGMDEEYACDPTEDKIFLLSEYEVTKYSKSTEAYDSKGKGNSRIRVTTDFAKANFAYQDTTDGCGGWWWLRSPFYGGSYGARYVRYDGSARENFSVSLTRGGVVPALSISF